MRQGKTLTWLGGIGAVVGLTCCLTPILPVLLGGVGMTGALSFLYRDAILLPFAALSLLVMAFGIWLMRHGR